MANPIWLNYIKYKRISMKIETREFSTVLNARSRSKLEYSKWIIQYGYPKFLEIEYNGEFL